VRAIHKSFIAAVLLALTLCVSAASPPKRVLVLHSFGPEFGDSVAKPLRDELDRQLPGRVDLYESWLASARFASAGEDPHFASYIRSLFADRPLDLIVTFGAPAANFLERNRQSLFPKVPALLADVEERRVGTGGAAANTTSVSISVSFPEIVENIQRVLPGTSHLAIVIGNSPIERYWVDELQHSLRPFAAHLNVIWLNELSFDDLLKRVATLPPHTAIFYVLLSPEVAGIPADEDRAIAKLHAAANAPIFSYTDAYLGKGIVGGPLVSSEEVARATASVALRILGGEQASDIRTPPIPMSAPRFDVRELVRWNISEAHLPAGSAILFRKPTLWERYRWEITAATALMLLEASLIVSLLYERRRRRLAEVETHRRIAELAHMNRRATVGELSGAIAHELNQPLGAILRNSEAAELILETPAPDIRELKEIVRDIKHDDERAGEVIRRLRQLLAKAPLESQEIELNAMLGEVFEFLSAQAAARRITLSTRMTPQAPRVDGDRIQLQQVILNLVMNAMDAIGGDRSGERAIIGRTLLAEGGFAEVSIEDSGPGIPTDKARQIFEPFFTTKTSGMGMGLSIARTIVERHGGRIWAENKKAGGAVFRFTLPLLGRQPRAAEPEDVRHDTASAANAPLGGMLRRAAATARPALKRVDLPTLP
jgi:signal transduction histidine kinase